MFQARRSRRVSEPTADGNSRDWFPAENSGDRRNVLSLLRDFFQPSNVIEQILVDRLAHCWWRSRTTFGAEGEADREFDRTVQVLLHLRRDPAFPPDATAKPPKSKAPTARVVPIRPAA